MSDRADARRRLCLTQQEPAFELLVVGCGGGPLENNLSSYLVKPKTRRWSDPGATLALDAGSSLGAIASLAADDPALFADFFPQGDDDHRDSSSPFAPITDAAAAGPAETPRSRDLRAAQNAGVVWDAISAILLTHGHLDHLAGLVLASAVQCARPSGPKPVWGLERTVRNLERAMGGGVWPVLGARRAAGEEGACKALAYEYRHPTPIPISTEVSSSVGGESELSFTAWPVAHGPNPAASASSGADIDASEPTTTTMPASERDVYHSTAVFVRVGAPPPTAAAAAAIPSPSSSSASPREFLFFGDVEPDSVSRTGLNRRVWECAAPKIVDRRLEVIFLECSYPASQPREYLFGHLSPPYVLEELKVLADLVQAERERRRRRRRGAADPGSGTEADEEAAAGAGDGPPLRGVKVVITHIKDELYPSSPPPTASPSPSKSAVGAAANMSPTSSPPETVHERIERELNELEREVRTGVEFVIAEQGMRIVF
ncbi:hypothetical protein JCM8202_005838 [Rhodotorula sphaerocarpa]